MVAKRSSRALALLLLVVPSAACALGLGDIRLRSRLDEPLDAQIALLDLTPGALESLTVKLAPEGTFSQYGLSWAPYLTGVHLKTIRTANGQMAVQLTSDRPITDPIVTLLVEASWNRGRLIREYTVLLNPPIYVPTHTQAAQASVAPPVTGPGARVGLIASAAAPAAAATLAPALAPAPAPSAPQSAVAASASAAPHSVHVQPGDTLSGIASRIAGTPLNSGRTGQWMLALYRSNRSAFDHNMNLLRSGTILRVPSAASVATISTRAAWGEIRTQYAAWRGNSHPAESAAAGPGRLRLVAPSGSGAAGGTSSVSSASNAQVSSLEHQVSSLKSQLQNEKRLLQLKDVQLAKLQAQFAQHSSQAPSLAAAPPAARPAAQVASAKAPHAPSAAALAPRVSRPTQAPPRRLNAASQGFRPASRGRLLGTLLGYWWVVALLVLVLIGYVGSRLLRSRRQAEFDDSLGKLAAAGAGGSARPVPRARQESSLADTASMRKVAADRDAPAFVVEESGSHERQRLSESAPLGSSHHISADQTISSETAINLDQGDPLAEADFHMAYGLYDQAADLIRIAISREPDRRELKLKLLEVFFVWGNKEQFVQTAHELADTRDQAAPGEWEKTMIMGKQLAPEEPLFASGTVSGAASAGVDLDLEAGEGHAVDFDVLSATAVRTGESLTPATLDLDIGSALGEPDAEATAQSPGTATDRNMALLDTDLADNATGSTREMTATMPGADSARAELGTEVEGPTIEQPALRVSEAPLRQKLETAMRQSGTEQTAELAIDDLGLDLGVFDGATQALPEQGSSETPTMIAGLDEDSRKLMDEASAQSAEPAPAPTGTTNSWQLDEQELAAVLSEGEGGTDTSATSRLDALDAGNVDFDVGAGAHEPSRGANGSGLDLDIGTATLPEAGFTSTQKLDSEDLALPELEPVTMSEVGTKLDLARAYMDMGDPEGARNILEEVMHEGSVAQRQEAERLMGSLPG